MEADDFGCADVLPVCGRHVLDSSGNVTATNTGGPAGLLSRHTSSGSTFYTYDPQGNPVQRLTGTGSITGTSLFDAYGLRASTDGSIDPYSGYHSQEGYFSDNETGFELLGSRYYDPSTCRFVTRDPAGYAGGMNLYGYCDGNPIGESDPSGLAGFGWRDNENAWNNFKSSKVGKVLDDPLVVGGAGGVVDDVFTFHDAKAALYTPKGYGLRNQLRMWGAGISLALLIPSGGEGRAAEGVALRTAKQARGWASGVVGRAFESDTLRALNLAKNEEKFASRTLKGRFVNVVPDSVQGAITEVKSGQNVSLDKQIQGEINLAKQQGLPYM